MNEACLDLQQAGMIIFSLRRSRLLAQTRRADSKSGRCPYLPPKDKEERLLDFRDQILVSKHSKAMSKLTLINWVFSRLNQKTLKISSMLANSRTSVPITLRVAASSKHRYVGLCSWICSPEIHSWITARHVAV